MAAPMRAEGAPRARRASGDDYAARRAWIAEYFDRTAAAAWARLTSDAPVGRVRASVRAGRDRMRATLLGWLPLDLRGARVLDAGCGTGALAVELAMRGAEVEAIDLSPTLVGLARERVPEALAARIRFSAGDMLDPRLGEFTYVVAMDSIIHYRRGDMLTVLSDFRSRAEESVLFTVAPRTPLLATAHAVGRLFPRGDRAPAIEPVVVSELTALLNLHDGWDVARRERVASGFYTSEALELKRTVVTAPESEELFL